MTNISAIGLSLTLLLGVLTLLLPRRFSFIPIIISACYITLGQRIVFASLDFTMLRIVILFGWIRIIVRKDTPSIKFNPIDNFLILYVISSVATYTLLRQSSEAFINRLGFAYDSIGLYFLFRFLIRDFSNIFFLFRSLAIIVVPLVIFMLVEKATGKNLFYMFGGVQMLSQIREGSVRCQGPFSHSILAGTFGATLIPFFIPLWFTNEGNKVLAVIGLFSATIIAVTPASSGPAMAFLFAILGLTMWHLRDHMRALRWIVLIFIITLHIIMKASVWFLIGRLGHVIGGSGWHRSELIDTAIRHFDEWWFIGTEYTRHWMPTGVKINPDVADITNQFIRVGVDGGVITLILFITLIVVCFKHLGKALTITKNESIDIRMTLWCLGASLFAHIVSFFSVRYFDQIIVFWYLLLALISTAGSLFVNPALCNGNADD